MYGLSGFESTYFIIHFEDGVEEIVFGHFHLSQSDHDILLSLRINELISFLLFGGFLVSESCTRLDDDGWKGTGSKGCHGEEEYTHFPTRRSYMS